jgi:hypothetical protein
MNTKDKTVRLEALFWSVSLDGDQLDKKWRMQDYGKIRPWVKDRPMTDYEWEAWKILKVYKSLKKDKKLIIESFKNGNKVAEIRVDNNIGLKELSLILEFQEISGRKWKVNIL